MLANILIFSILHSVYCNNGWKTKQNYTIIEITAFNTRERAALYKMQTTDDTIIFLNGVTNVVSSPMYAMVKDCCITDFTSTLDMNGIEYVQVLRDSVLKQFKGDDLPEHEQKSPVLEKEFLDWDEIRLWVKIRLKKYPALKKMIIGDTYEGKELFILKMISGPDKPAIFILGGEQGRDKMSVAVILNFIHNILTTHIYAELTNVYNLYFMPVFNPDGYSYSMKTAWYWTKNRRVFFPEKKCPSLNNERAVGVNVDRNWFMTNTTYVEGAECGSVFLGYEALSEEETRSVAVFLNLIAKNLMAFINVQGYGSLITVPYAEDNEFANNFPVLSEMLLHATNAAFIKYNISCNLCSTHCCFYNNIGTVADWVKRNMNVPVVFTLYLKHANSFLPRIEHVPTLLQHFAIIVKETLLLGYDIYGPLFNCAMQLTLIFDKAVALTLMLSLKYILN